MRVSFKTTFYVIFNLILLSSCSNDDSMQDTPLENETSTTPTKEAATSTDGFTTNDNTTALPKTTFGNETNCKQTEDDTFNAQFLILVNKHRASINVKTLTANTIANYLAFKNSKYMICQNDFNHTNFNEANRILSNQVNSRGAAENIIQGFNTPESMLEGWLNSPPHKINLENPNYTHTGFSAIKSNGRYWGTQIFYR